MSGKGNSILHPMQNRRDQMLIESKHDPYFVKTKHKDLTACKSCTAVFKKGRWQWQDKGAQLVVGDNNVLCPACQRIEDKLPAGYLSIDNDYLGKRKNEILNLIKHTEECEAMSHPMKRIMQIEEGTEKLLLTFTHPKLARNIGDAIHHAYGGELDYTYTPGEFMLRVTLGK